MIKKVDKNHLPQLEKVLKKFKEAYDLKREEFRKEWEKGNPFTLSRLTSGDNPTREEERAIKILKAIVSEIEENEFALIESHEQYILGEDFVYKVV